MHELFYQVLSNRDLSKAGDLFSVEDKDIGDDLSQVLKKIQEIAGATSYLTSNNDQSVVEICINRVTSAIRETGSIEKHAGALVSLLDTCLRNNLKPTSKEEDPPHAKIASDILSCLFMNYSKKPVMERALPIAVRFLQQGNRELSRNMCSYLSLAAIDNARLLAGQIYTILDSIVYHKNKSLARVLLQIYPENKDPIHDHIPQLVQLLPECDASDKNSLLQLFGHVVKVTPRLMETFLPQLCVNLSQPSISPMILPMFVDMSSTNPEPFVNHVTQLKQVGELQVAMLSQVAQILGMVGRIDKIHAKDVVAWIVTQLSSTDNQSLPLLLKEVKAISESYPSILPDHISEISKYSQNTSVATQIVVQQLKDISNKSASLPEKKTVASQTEGIVTVIKIGNPPNAQSKADMVTVLARTSLASLPHTKSASTSTRDINYPQTMSVPPTTTSSNLVAASVSSVTVSHTGSNAVLHNTLPARPPSASQTLTVSQTFSDRSTPIPPTGPVTSIATITRTTVAGSKVHMEDRKPMPTVSTTTKPTYVGQPHAIPFPDAVQHFCEKHLDKIKAYIDNVSARLPIPIKAVREEARHRRRCKLNFICFGQGQNCLYSQAFFTMRTKNARIWIHLMFLAIQARSQKAVSQQDPSVGNLKALWDSLKLDSGNFVRLVTSSFPSSKDQDILLHDLHVLRYFDVFEFNAAEGHWACFLCNHPERAFGLMQDGLPLMEGQLKEKKGKWKFFKRWKTRYFTLSGATITYNKKDSGKATLPISKIQTVKAVRKGMRDIPKAFEIFTNEQTYVFKAKDSQRAEQWVQCLQIAVARTQKQDVVTAFDLENWAFQPQTRGRSISSGPSTSAIAAVAAAQSIGGKVKNTQTKL